MMFHLADILLGAALVATGVLAAAIADRIRGIGRAPAASRPRATRRDVPTAADDASDAVVGALVTAGYPRRIATAATAACPADRRASLEAWTRAALARAARGDA